jgi:hypothetical protein
VESRWYIVDMRVAFAFFKAKHGGPFSRAITWRTGGPYSHVEFVLPGRYAVTEEGTGIVRELCFSSYEGDGGVRVKHIHLAEWWDVVEFECPEDVVWRVWKWACSQVGKKYDWAGIMGFVNPWRKGGDPGRWFCSEICYRIAVMLGLVEEGEPADKVSPRRLFDLLTSPQRKAPPQTQ